MTRSYSVVLAGAVIVSACVEAEAPPISGEPQGSSGAAGALGSAGAGAGGGGADAGSGGGSGDGAAGSPASDAAGGTGTGATGGSGSGSAGTSASGGAGGSGGSEPCTGERFITPCNGTMATRCVNGVVEQVECSACSKLSCSAPCCGDVHPYVLDQGFTSQPDRFSNFNQSAASVEFDFGGPEWQGAIGWFLNPTIGNISAVRVQTSVSGASAGAPFVTLEREGAGCEYMLDGSGNATFPGTNCWGGFNPDAAADVAWVAVRTKSTGAGQATLTVTSIDISP